MAPPIFNSSIKLLCNYFAFYFFTLQVFVNFAKKQSDNLEQQEANHSNTVPSPMERVLSLLRPRTTPTELRALVVEEPEDLETDDEGLISFEEERVRFAFLVVV